MMWTLLLAVQFSTTHTTHLQICADLGGFWHSPTMEEYKDTYVEAFRPLVSLMAATDAMSCVEEST